MSKRIVLPNYVLARYLNVHVISLPWMLLNHKLIFKYLQCKVAYGATGGGWWRI